MNQITTDDAVPTQIISVTTVMQSVTNLEYEIIAFCATDNTVAKYKYSASVVNIGDTLTLMGNTQLVAHNAGFSGGLPDIILSGTNIIIRVTGGASKGITWKINLSTFDVNYPL